MKVTIVELKNKRKEVEKKVKEMNTEVLTNSLRKDNKTDFSKVLQKIFVEPINTSFVDKQMKDIGLYEEKKVRQVITEIFTKENIEQGHIFTLMLLKAKLKMGA